MQTERAENSLERVRVRSVSERIYECVFIGKTEHHGRLQTVAHLCCVPCNGAERTFHTIPHLSDIFRRVPVLACNVTLLWLACVVYMNTRMKYIADIMDIYFFSLYVRI